MQRLSVVIPVFNVEKTLERCLKSVVGQSYANMEIILVDDGSTDSSPQICELWRARDERIKVIHKENGGLSDARNAGIDIATSDFITFIDSDDYIAPDTYLSVMKVFQDLSNTSNAPIDIIEYSADIFVGRKDGYELNLADRVYTDMNEYWLQGKAYTHTYAWNKIYRRELFKDVRFPKGKVFEDVHTLPLLLSKCHVVATTSRGRYYYCYNPTGITATADGKALASLLEAHTQSIITDEEYYRHVLNIQIDVFCLTDNPIRLNERNHINPKGLPFKAKIKIILFNTLGLNGLCKLYKLIR